ncbi:hypothetical protein BGX38DRAFT_1233310 [Terfezia claveryi]|nr:hypothetical protein BGX38DRAFT_1233310 [Terfezia claveryi]
MEAPALDAHSRIHHTQHHSSQDPVETETSSTPSVASHSAAVGSSLSSYAFITHSQEGLRENMPPMIDNAGLARRRRRRTSQHDQAILEEEYRKCDRPDKTRRREIAALVEMGDKEVQVSLNSQIGVSQSSTICCRCCWEYPTNHRFGVRFAPHICVPKFGGSGVCGVLRADVCSGGRVRSKPAFHTSHTTELATHSNTHTNPPTLSGRKSRSESPSFAIAI